MIKKKRDSSKQGKNGSNNGYMPAVNLLSEGTEIQGEIRSNDDIRIDGILKGTIHSKAKVVIGSTGKVEGQIYCENADVLGEIEGTVKVKDVLFLKSSASVDGDIDTGKLVVESGAKFNGNCSMGASKQIGAKEKRIDSGEERTKSFGQEQLKERTKAAV